MTNAAARAPSAVTKPTMPAPVTVSRMAFIEFAADPDEARALGALLDCLSFAPVARHRRKAVTRWQQGGINIVVNSESEGFAHSFDVVHGASVCAIGRSLIHFIGERDEDAVWAQEFPHKLGDPNGIGLNAIDHIAQSMLFEEFLGALLYHVALFDVTKTPQVNIADPLGLLQSQAVECANKEQSAPRHPQRLGCATDAVDAFCCGEFRRRCLAYRVFG